MRDRFKKIERIKAVQHRMHQLAEWKLARLNKEKADLDQDQRELVETLNRDEQLQGLFIDAMAKRLNSLARRTETVNQARIAQNERLTEAGLRLKRSERMSDRTRRQHDDHMRKQGFNSLLEALSQGPRRDD